MRAAFTLPRRPSRRSIGAALASTVPAWCLIVALSTSATARAEQNPFLPEAIQRIRDFDERTALQLLDQARRWPHNTPADLAQVHLYTGLAHAGLAHEREAVDAFRAALVLDASLRLPDDVSPRVKEWWLRAGGVVDVPAPVELLPPEKTGIALPVEEPRAAPSRRLTWTGALLAGAGAIVVGGGIYFSGQAVQLDGQARQDPTTAFASPVYRQAVRDAQTGNILYGVGGPLLIAGSALLIYGLVHGS